MSDFDLFNQALDEYKKTTKENIYNSESDNASNSTPIESSKEEVNQSSCSHINTTNEKGF